MPSILTNVAKVTYKELGSDLSKSSNNTIFNIIGGNMVVIKTQTPNQGLQGTEVTFTITIKNTGSNSFTNLKLTGSLLDVGYTFISGTVTVDSTSIPSANPNNGIALSDLTGGSTTIITFKATVN